MRAYRCPNCRQFHLTSHGKKGKPMKENKDLVTKWETTGLLQKASDKNKLAGLLEQSINIVLNCLKGQEGEDAERKLLFPAIVRIAFDENYNFEVQALWKDYQTWLQKTSGFEPTNVTVKRFLTSVERKYL